MARRMAVLGVAVLVLFTGGSAGSSLHPGFRALPAKTVTRPVTAHKRPDRPVRIAMPLVAFGTGPAGSVRTTGTASVALTFDDGPWPETIPILDLLAQYHVKATFCLIGRQVSEYAAIVRRIVAEGHTLCDHTWAHDLRLATRTPAQIRADLQRTLDAVHAAAPGAPVRYFRCPGGLWSPEIVAVAASMGMTSLHWTVDPQDWRRPGVGSIIGNVTARTGPGGIVLLHDGGGDRAQTLVALRTILPNLVHRYTLEPMP
jgi:peptidoglycan/xylan/chitin deacetylase (PgdA/CDA1 family)